MYDGSAYVLVVQTCSSEWQARYCGVWRRNGVDLKALNAGWDWQARVWCVSGES